MPTKVLPLGTLFTMTMSEAYALPAVQSRFFTDLVSVQIRQSTTQAFTISTAITLTDGVGVLAGGFIKSLNGDCVAVLTRS